MQAYLTLPVIFIHHFVSIKRMPKVVLSRYMNWALEQNKND